MAKKQYNTASSFKTFNKRQMPKNPDGLLDKMVASAVDAMKNIDVFDYKPWTTLGRYQEQFDKTWNASVEFKRYWLDAAVREIECWIWNHVMEHHGRNNRKSDGLAQQAMDKFRKGWE